MVKSQVSKNKKRKRGLKSPSPETPIPGNLFGLVCGRRLRFLCRFFLLPFRLFLLLSQLLFEFSHETPVYPSAHDNPPNFLFIY